jgi:hypothetical protein
VEPSLSNSLPPSSFCGVVIPGRPVITNLQALALDKYILPIENISDVVHICCFLTNAPPLLENLGAAIYFSVQPFEEWKYSGYISSSKPSTLIRLKWPQDCLDRNMIGQIGINVLRLEEIEKLEEIRANEKKAVLTDQGNAALNQVGKKVVTNFFNFIQSSPFSVPNPKGIGMDVLLIGYFLLIGMIDVIPASLVNEWMNRFDQRCRNNPNFWYDLI